MVIVVIDNKYEQDNFLEYIDIDEALLEAIKTCSTTIDVSVEIPAGYSEKYDEYYTDTLFVTQIDVFDDLDLTVDDVFCFTKELLKDK